MVRTWPNDGLRFANELGLRHRLIAVSSPDRRKMTDPQSRVEFWTERLSDPCFVYVVRSGSAIKIGKAVDVWDRIAGLQCGNPVKLELLYVVPGGHELETRFHRWLEHDCIHGEWFDGPNVADALRAVEELSEAMVAAYAGAGEAPDWKALASLPFLTQFDGRKRRSQAPVAVRFTDPDPVPPTQQQLESAERLLRAGYRLERGAWVEPTA